MFISKPRVLFLDAMGTLFYLKQSVGKTYSSFAAEHNISVNPIELEQQFRLVFRKHHAPAFSPDLSNPERLFLERQWWHTVVLKTFEEIMGPINAGIFAAFFDDVFHYFSTAAAWNLYPEVPMILERWAQTDIELGIISNFDSRLFQVLDALEIHSFFQSVTISSQAGAAKPEARIFRSALEKHRCIAEHALHIGDQWTDDYEGATLAGLMGIWLNRTEGANSGIYALDELRWHG